MEKFFCTGYKKYLKAPEDFQVEEVIDPKFTRKFITKGSSIEKMQGKYSLCNLKKKGLTTEYVIRMIVQELGIPKEDVGFAGLKDKNAVTSQYLTIKNVGKEKIEKVKLENAKLVFIQQTDKKIVRGDLLCNRFRIRLHEVPDKCRVREQLAGVRGGFPNYFGPQRFGSHQDNHLVGKLLLQGRFRDAERMAGRMEKERARFFVHAYQSWLFNQALEPETKDFTEVRIPGYEFWKPTHPMEKRMDSLLEKDGLKRTDFRIDKLRLSSRGAQRQVFVKPSNFKAKITEPIQLEFALPPGSFATALLAELLRNQGK